MYGIQETSGVEKAGEEKQQEVMVAERTEEGGEGRDLLLLMWHVVEAALEVRLHLNALLHVLLLRFRFLLLPHPSPRPVIKVQVSTVRFPGPFQQAVRDAPSSRQRHPPLEGGGSLPLGLWVGPNRKQRCRAKTPQASPPAQLWGL